MSKLIDKLSSYDIFNNLLPGVVFCVIATSLYPINLVQKDLLTGAFFYFFVGVILSRIGSSLIEPLLKLVGFVKFSSYNDFLAASKADPKIDVLSEKNNMFRSLLSAMVALLFLKIHFWGVEGLGFYKDHHTLIIIVSLSLLFLFSYKKQTAYVKARVDNSNLLKSDAEEEADDAKDK